MNDSIVGFIGLGLIGGSIARALKKSSPAVTTVSYNYYADRPNPSLEAAKKDGVIDVISTDLEADFKDCDIIFLCAPVLENIKYLTMLKNLIKPSCIITDVGSVKGNIHNKVAELHLCNNFVGGHPMTGSEKTGYSHSNASLLENAFYMLTKTTNTPSDKFAIMETLVTNLGSIPVPVDADYHDDIVAAISHVPHIIAASLVHMVKDADDDRELMRQVAAGGFKDITRIASSSSVMWQNICLSNTESILHFLRAYIDQLNAIAVEIAGKKEENLLSFFADAKEYRDSIPNKSTGLIHRVYEVYLDLTDEAGAIATVATLLAKHDISIKNIGILHNREYQEGALRIELYTKEAQAQTIDILTQYQYTIYQ